MIWNWKKTGIRSAALLLGGTLLLPGIAAHAAHASAPYTAQEGDTFWLLSKRFGVPLEKLMKANPDIDPMNIYEGLTLNVPSGTVKSAMAKKSAPSLQADAVKDPAQTANSVTTASGESLAFTKVLDIKATAYSDAPEENGWGPVDYFGNPLKLGTIAVDPKVIPFGTKVYITGYDFNGLPQGGMIAKATDSGSAIKGNRIDIFVPGSRSFVSTFGFQNVKVYILK
ncbi:LysM peptidoglycan-binding domain-containing protein [Cohnella sp. CFH 77786]|uniref:3D domain-containing protein n=1 Tax=Cohnella sp. CFH 77786 TaxID=2662265 RepID=UPI001C60A8AA|nr:3D domain-containing protein [Cohnella sp. CFH 77786]MBW5447317.1 LysM peptidoglycan-binding domain-containing protein [Cohnella sp. CFH 77786]